jgi:hypothetical protein
MKWAQADACTMGEQTDEIWTFKKPVPGIELAFCVKISDIIIIKCCQ